MKDGGDTFVKTLEYEYNPLFKLDLKDVEDFVLKKLPTLKYYKDVVLVINGDK
jgi:hypothetical protein